jgi:hypothetical protein
MVIEPGRLAYVWRPVTSGRHVFAAAATRTPQEETVRAFCGAEVVASELHAATERDWIRGDTCMACWGTLAVRSHGGQPYSGRR